MAAHYWIKLYQDILRDPKMGRLSDSAWRRCIELFLLAGEQDERDGMLPTIGDISWQLRVDEEQLESDLQELSRAGIVEINDDRTVFISKFAKRQEAVGSTERWRKWRDRQRQKEYEATENQQNPNSEQTASNEPQTNRLTETETETETELAAAVSAYENNIALITEAVSEKIIAAVDDYSAEWVIKAIKIAAEANKRNWRYINGILKNWKAKGHPDIIPADQNGHHPGMNPGAEAWQTILKCVSAGSYKSLDREGNIAKLLREQFDPPGIMTAPDKELSFIGKRFIEAYNHEYGNH